MARPHGTKGELYIWSLTDYPDTTFKPGVELRIADPEGRAPDPLFPALTIEAARPFRKGYLVRFAGLTDRAGGDLLRDRYLLRPFDEAEPLEDDELFHHQIVGMEVVLPDGIRVGRIIAIHPMDPIDLIEVNRGRDTILIPFARAIVVEWDLETGRMVVDPPEGLLEL